MKKMITIPLMLAVAASLAACEPEAPPKKDEMLSAKPVIYLYPEAETEVAVTLDYDGELTCTYPAYEDGWTVTAFPDGTLTDGETAYNYLYWEGVTDAAYDLSEGFCVPGGGLGSISGSCPRRAGADPTGGQRIHRLLAADAGRK